MRRGRFITPVLEARDVVFNTSVLEARDVEDSIRPYSKHTTLTVQYSDVRARST